MVLFGAVEYEGRSHVWVEGESPTTKKGALTRYRWGVTDNWYRQKYQNGSPQPWPRQEPTSST